jgi:VIT1/CCC1 family predicted Fe2+/Mn2+ transporter
MGPTVRTEMMDRVERNGPKESNVAPADRPRQTRFSFGATSAIITNLGIITGLDTLTHPKTSIIGALLVIALADNLSDSFGIHFFQESEQVSKREVWLSTFTNFSTRVLVSLTFVALIYFLPIKPAVICSITWGLLVLAVMTFLVARQARTNPYSAVLVHLTIAILVVAGSHTVGGLFVGQFQ